MKLTGLFLVIALAVAACAPAGDEPAEEPVPSTTTPAEMTSDSPAYVAPDDELGGQEDDPAGEFATERVPGDDEVVVEDDTPYGTQNLQVPAESDLPDPAYDDAWPSQPVYPGPEIEMPLPRDGRP